jgi:hypothetical protein
MRDQPEHGSWCWGDTEVPAEIILVPYPKKEFKCCYCHLEVGRLDDVWVARSDDETVDEWECSSSPDRQHHLEPAPEPKPDPLDILAELGLD